ncbi:MAG: glutamine-synthetase adenylyltransferase, partial [Henriciella sp.]|nr:glutamine-synthetase adenylyltransferase [Henriciella sp.]
MKRLITAISKEPIAAIKTATAHAPYLARLSAKFSEDLASHGADGLFQRAIERCISLPEDTEPAEAMRVLRRAKSRAHLAIAALDLSQSDTLEEITRRITDFADAGVNAALRVTLAKAGLVQDGLFFAALGKMGAGELNYSSDIDMAVFYDAELLKGGKHEPVDAAIRVTQETMR